MGRIRSLHPSQWTEEDWVACSPLARLLLLGLRNVADDRGVFEWRPLSLKMQVLPGDQVDIDALLDELVAHGQLARFESAGRAYGVCVGWDQQPRRPHYRYPAPPTGVRATIPDNVRTDPDSDGECPPVIVMESESGIVEREKAGAPAGAALSLLDFDLPVEWRSAADDDRRRGKVGVVNLDAEWVKFRRHCAGGARMPLENWRSRWLKWAVNANASLAGNGAAEPASAEPTSRNSGPPAPIAHRLGPHGDQLRAAVDPVPFAAWLADLDFVGLRDGRLALSAPTKFCRQMALQEFEPAICRAWGARSLEITIREARQAPAEPRAGKLSRKLVRGKPPRPEQREIMMPIAGGAVADEAAAGLELDRQRGAA